MRVMLSPAISAAQLKFACIPARQMKEAGFSAGCVLLSLCVFAVPNCHF
jgi:hypothetical protein